MRLRARLCHTADTSVVTGIVGAMTDTRTAADIRTAYLDAAASATELVAHPAVAEAWTKPSALPGFSVGGLAAHLAAQLTYPASAIAAPEPEPAALDLLTHYSRARWIGQDIDNESNTGIRNRGEAASQAGPEAVAAEARAAHAALVELLARVPAGRRVPINNTVEWTLTVEDLLHTRLLEIVVHSDDLAVSASIPTPELPATVTEPVIDLLSRLSVRRHGATAVLRALSRAERSPATISAL